MSRMDIDAKMEIFINEMPYAYYNVAGRDNMSLADGAKDALGLCNEQRLRVGHGDSYTREDRAEHDGEDEDRPGSSSSSRSIGGLNKEANALLMAAVSTAKSLGSRSRTAMACL